MEQERKVCSDCGRLLELPAFSIKMRYKFGFQLKPKIYYKDFCKRCEEKQRIAFQEANPWYHKVHSTIGYHARKFKIKPKEFLETYDLAYEWFEKLFESAWQADWCAVCGKPFQEYGRGEMSLDQIKRLELPYRWNWRIVHRWDNSAKGRKTPQDFDIECKELWRERQDAFNLEPPNNSQLTFL